MHTLEVDKVTRISNEYNYCTLSPSMFGNSFYTFYQMYAKFSSLILHIINKVLQYEYNALNISTFNNLILLWVFFVLRQDIHFSYKNPERSINFQFLVNLDICNVQ